MISTTMASLRTLAILLAGGLVLSALGCGNNAAVEMESTSHLKHLTRAVLQYESENMKWPDKLSDVASVLGKADTEGKIGDGKDFAALIKNPQTGDNPGYEYVKPAEMLPGREGVVVLYQLRGGKRDDSLKVGFLDGGVGVVAPK